MDTQRPAGSGKTWGPLFGARARDWAETWEGPSGWGTPVYDYVLDYAAAGPGMRVLDCGCGAGRFARMAADRGASVAGIDAAKELIEIAVKQTPEGDFQVGDMEALPWPDANFDWVTGFSSFQFANDKARALAEARRVSRGRIAIVIPSRVADSGLTTVFKELFPLFPPEMLERVRQSGIFALSEPGRLEDVLTASGLTVQHDTEIECPIVFDSHDIAVRAFLGAGPTGLAIEHSGHSAVSEAVRNALNPLILEDGRIFLPGWYRVVVARNDATERES